MLDFVPLTTQNFPEYEENIMASEKIFPVNIRESPETYQEALRQNHALGVVAQLGLLYVGNAVGFSPCTRQCSVLRLDEVGTSLDGMIYLFNIVTMPEFQGNGFGRKLLQAFTAKAKNAGFNRVGGHFRGNGSLKNFKALGGRELDAFDNWFDTGERYTYCELAIA